MSITRTFPRLGRCLTRSRGVDVRTSHIRLGPNDTWSFPLRRGDVVVCESGTLWLTQTGHGQDVLLKPCCGFTSDHSGKLVASAANGETSFRLQRPVP